MTIPCFASFSSSGISFFKSRGVDKRPNGLRNLKSRSYINKKNLSMIEFKTYLGSLFDMPETGLLCSAWHSTMKSSSRKIKNPMVIQCLVWFILIATIIIWKERTTSTSCEGAVKQEFQNYSTVHIGSCIHWILCFIFTPLYFNFVC